MAAADAVDQPHDLVIIRLDDGFAHPLEEGLGQGRHSLRGDRALAGGAGPILFGRRAARELILDAQKPFDLVEKRDFPEGYCQEVVGAGLERFPQVLAAPVDDVQMLALLAIPRVIALPLTLAG